MRTCGGCTLCCKLVPVVEMRHGEPSFLKVANQKCPHQKFGKGCLIYNDYARKPVACGTWSCRWLSGKDTEDLPRPDRCGYVIDEAPDMLILEDNETKERTTYPAIQIWIGKRNSWHTPDNLNKYMTKMALKGFAIILRQDEKLAAGCIMRDGQWQYQIKEASFCHAPEDIAAVWREHGLI